MVDFSLIARKVNELLKLNKSVYFCMEQWNFFYIIFFMNYSTKLCAVSSEKKFFVIMYCFSKLALNHS